MNNSIPQLSHNEYQRYSRHIMLEEIGEAGQQVLKHACVLVIGVGGLGCAAAQFLAASGIGHLILVDADSVERSNLQRQILFKTNHLGALKVDAARKQLAAMNPEIRVTTFNNTIENTFLQDEFLKYFQQVDIVLDCTDNPASRYFINEQCVLHQKKLVSAAAIQGQGQLISIDLSTSNSPCYACLFPPTQKMATQNCATSGVLSPLLGVMGSLQATETLRLLLGMTAQLNQLHTINLWSMQFEQFTVPKNKHCTVCGH